MITCAEQFFFFQAEDGIRDIGVTGVQTCALPISEATGWDRDLDALMERLSPRFSRLEARRRARSYVAGLLAPLERKNGWQLAEAAGDASPDSVQDFLARMRWDADAVRDRKSVV